MRPVRVRDAKSWSDLRIRNQNSLLPWEPTGVGSWADRHQPASWPPLYAILKSEAKRGTILPFVIELDGAYVGQLTVCLLYTSPSPRDGLLSRMPSSA